MTTAQYISNINQRFLHGNATEHTYRGDLQQLIESIVSDIHATNEPKRQSCGAPDYILTRKEIPIGFIEAKDIGDKDLKGEKKTGNKEQFDRYKASLSNLIFTDYIDFHLYRDGQLVTSIAIGELTEKEIKPLTENFVAFENLLRDFCVHISQTIKSSKKLAEMMAGKARLLSDVIGNALISDEENQENSTLRDQMKAFKDILIHDITPQGFADVYAQTIAYGMFCARLHDPTLPTFSRQEAFELIPKSNPFLKKLFGYIAGLDLDDRIKWIVEGLVEIFLACNVEELLKNYGKQTKTEEPIIHFYETFLSEYDPKLRKARGVWYTPAPVVNFIVRAVDDILKTEFNLPQGLADTSKTKIKVQTQGTNKLVEQEVHKVQILDPATGTGTFLAEVIRHIHKKFEGQQGIWTNYIEQHLIPRLNGFELLMASYAMAHLQLDLLLTETGFKPTINQRIRVFLTNSLEESHPDTGSLFANWLSTEANEANLIKRDTPVMCVIGNPPYSSSSSNKNKWIEGLITDYKKDLNERKINLDDDYIKFIRFGQHFIDRNNSGILAYICNNSFIDGVTHRQMRKKLLESFDKLYILDLHGDVRKKESAIDGSNDQNVFDIMQGVSINIFVKTGNKKPNELGHVFHHYLLGKREFKYEALNSNSLNSFKWEKINNKFPYYFFGPKDFSENVIYEKGFSINEIFINRNSGVQTKNDNVTIQLNENKIQSIVNDFINYSEEELIQKYNLKLDGVWNVYDAKNDILRRDYEFTQILYRPFDIRYTVLTKKSGGFIGRPRYETMKHIVNKNNISLIVNKQFIGEHFNHIGITKLINCHGTFYLGNKAQDYICPLYLYPDSNQSDVFESSERKPNLSMDIVQQIADKLGLEFICEKETNKNTFAPIDILDYIYAVLHSPSYREKYKEFLKIDFPRVPYPKDKDRFWKLVKLGAEIRLIHLLESPSVDQYITQYPIDGDNSVKKIRFESYDLTVPSSKSSSYKSMTNYEESNPNNKVDNSYPQPHLQSNDDMMLHEPEAAYTSKSQIDLGRVYINESQFFDNVPTLAWTFYIGGYQPAQKWLKDRKDRKLEYDDILHYQKIIVALTETDRLMKEIDKVGVE